MTCSGAWMGAGRLSAAAAMAAALSLGPGAAQGGEWPERLDGHGGPVRGIAIAETGQEVLSGSFDYTVIHWSLDNGEATIRNRLIGHDGPVNDVAFIPQTSLAVSASDDGTVGVWELARGELIARLPAGGERVLDIDVSADGRLLAAAGWDGLARVWTLEDRVEVARMEGHEGNLHAVAFSEDGGRLYTGGYDGTIRMWNAVTGDQLHVVHRHGWGINVVRALPGDQMLLFGSLDGTASVVDIATGEIVETLEEHLGPVLAADVDAQHGIAVLGGADGHMRVYRLNGWSVEHDHNNPYGPIWAAAVTPEAAMVYYAGLDDFVIGLQIDPRLDFDPAVGVFPRRFQVRDEADLGELQFARKCSVCHTLAPDDGNRAGPTLYRLFGRKAGTLPGYPYSEALRESDIVWTEETVTELFDHGPDVVTPGTKMPIQRLRDPDELEALVAFLKDATAGPEEGGEAGPR